MSFKYNGNGIKPMTPGGYLIPAGRYRLRIVDTDEGKTTKGDYMITVHFKVVGGAHDGKQVRFHRVTFMGRDADGAPKKGAGFAIAFLKAIGQPYEGDSLEVNHLRWRGRELEADVIEEPYEDKVNNKVKEVYPVEQKQETGAEEEVPF